MLVQLVLRDPAQLVYHGEPVLRDGVLVGAVTSGAYGHSLGASVCLAFVAGESVTSEWLAQGHYQVGVGANLVTADLLLRPPTLRQPSA